jgi:hypothetical protein
VNEQELRMLVRQSIQRHLGGDSPAPDPSLRPAPALQSNAPVATTASCSDHSSHALYIHLENASGACLIEPAVACNHCGYCQSHGH